MTVAQSQNKNKVIDVAVVYQLTLAHKQDLLVLYKNVWWSSDRTLENIETIIQKTSLIIGLVYPANARLIGFTRVLSDYFKYAYIYHVIIHPDYHELKLGRKLLGLILQHPDIKNITCIELTCRKTMMPFYKQLGFSENYGESIAMRRRKD